MTEVGFIIMLTIDLNKDESLRKLTFTLKRLQYYVLLFLKNTLFLFFRKLLSSYT